MTGRKGDSPLGSKPDQTARNREGVSSIEPNDSGGEVNRGEEVAGGLVIAGGDGTELLEPGEEILDQMARFVEVAIVGAR